jgi:hypothetical protein
MELWKDIEGFENYQVSSWGRVRGANGILKPYKNKKGYLKVGLMNGGKSHKKRVNRLVAMAFIDNPNGCPFVDHIDGNKENNSITNLRWVTDRENREYAAVLRALAKTMSSQCLETFTNT